MATFRDLSSRGSLEKLNEQLMTRRRSTYIPPSYQATQFNGSVYGQPKIAPSAQYYPHLPTSLPPRPPIPYRSQYNRSNTFLSHQTQAQHQNNSSYPARANQYQYHQDQNYYNTDHYAPSPWRNRSYNGQVQVPTQRFEQERSHNGQAGGRGHGCRFRGPGRGEPRRENGIPDGPRPPRPAHKPWITQELKNLIRERNEAERKALFTQDPTDWYRFKVLRAKLAPIINKAKFDYECDAPKTKSLFYCDPCDKSCPDQESLDAHKAEHMICKLDGCTFTAHPKVVVKHIQMQHSTDLYEKIAGYKTPEEIQLWINDRKKGYPTASNIERKKAEKAEQMQRGERMSKPSKNEGLYTLSQARRKIGGLAEKKNELRMKRLGNSQRYVQVTGNKSEVVTLKNFYASVKSNSKGVLEGKELTLWKNYTGYRTGRVKPEPESGDENEHQSADATGVPTFSDDEDEVTSQTKNVKSDQTDNAKMLPSDEKSTVGPINKMVDQESCPSALTTGRLALVAYSSDSELEDGEISEGPDEIPIAREDPNLNSSHGSRNEVQASGDSSSCSTSARPEQSTPSRGRQQNKRKNSAISLAKTLVQKARKVVPNADSNQNGNSEEHQEADDVSTAKVPEKKPAKIKPKIIQRRRRRPRMLEHLLAPEIMHERNQLLQICRFIADNNFFDGITEDMNLDSSDDDFGALEEEYNEMKKNVSNGDTTVNLEVSNIVPE